MRKRTSDQTRGQVSLRFGASNGVPFEKNTYTNDQADPTPGTARRTIVFVLGAEVAFIGLPARQNPGKKRPSRPGRPARDRILEFLTHNRHNCPACQYSYPS